MKEIFKKTTNSIIFSSIIAIIVGLILIFYPSISLKTMGIIAAIYIIVYGIILIILDVKAYKYYIPFDGMLPGILSVVLGIILICKPSILSIVFAFAIGVWIILTSINSLKLALALKDEETPWILLLILGILDLILGVIVIFNPFEASLTLSIFIGIMLLVHAIIDIVDMIIIKKDVKRISNAFEKRIK